MTAGGTSSILALYLGKDNTVVVKNIVLMKQWAKSEKSEPNELKSTMMTFPTKVPVERTPSSVRAKFAMTLTNGRRRPFYGFGPSRLLSETSMIMTKIRLMLFVAMLCASLSVFDAADTASSPAPSHHRCMNW